MIDAVHLRDLAAEPTVIWRAPGRPLRLTRAGDIARSERRPSCGGRVGSEIAPIAPVAGPTWLHIAMTARRAEEVIRWPVDTARGDREPEPRSLDRAPCSAPVVTAGLDRRGCLLTTAGSCTRNFWSLPEALNLAERARRARVGESDGIEEAAHTVGLGSRRSAD